VLALTGMTGIAMRSICVKSGKRKAAGGAWAIQRLESMLSSLTPDQLRALTGYDTQLIEELSGTPGESRNLIAIVGSKIETSPGSGTIRIACFADRSEGPASACTERQLIDVICMASSDTDQIFTRLQGEYLMFTTVAAMSTEHARRRSGPQAVDRPTTTGFDASKLLAGG
jgi:hypothetical protein